MARDSQRSKVYEAEMHLHALCDFDRFDSVTDCQAYVNSVTRSRWWRQRFPFTHKVKVLPGRGCRRAMAVAVTADEMLDGYDAAIKLPKQFRDTYIILHELCHHAVVRTIRTKPEEAAHGREFCRNLLALVKRFLGSEYEQTLRECFKITGVKWHKKRNLSPEQRAAMAERARANFGLT